MVDSPIAGQLVAGRGEIGQPASCPGAKPVGAWSGGDRPKVLIVDADPASVTSLREFLALKEYEVLAAADGPEALQKMKEGPPDAVLLAIRLPTMHGLEVLWQLRVFRPEVPVLMVTRVREEAVGRAALRGGAWDYLTKPVDLPYLEMSLWHAVMRRLL